MTTHIQQRIEDAIGTRPTSVSRLHGGSVSGAYRLNMPDGESLVAKTTSSSGTLDIEGYMLRYLKQHSDAPVPTVLHSTPDLLVMTFVQGNSHLSPSAQRHAAEILAALHSITQPQFGLERDTLIGPLHQPNPLTASWIEFFRDQRLRYMAQVAHDAGRLPSETLRRIDKLAGRLSNWLDEPEAPSLIHGDLWTTNILAANDRVTALIDPAIYYAHPEIELAYTTLFGTFGDAFFRRYNELRPVRPGFFEVRRGLYNLYPLLVHVRLFGGGYLGSVEHTLRRLGV